MEPARGALTKRRAACEREHLALVVTAPVALADDAAGVHGDEVVQATLHFVVMHPTRGTVTQTRISREGERLTLGALLPLVLKVGLAGSS